MKLSETASAFGLHSYGKQVPNGQSFERFYAIASAVLDGFGIAATYLGIDGDGYPDDYRKLGSRSHQNLVKASFRGIRGLSIVSNPEGSNEPSYDGYAEVSLSFAESREEVTLSFVVNEAFVRFASKPYDEAWGAFLGLNAWDFGYGFAGEVAKDPGLHILGADNGKLTAAEQAALNAWYGTLPDERLERLRDTYTYNFVSNRQLDYEVAPGTTLRQFIQGGRHGSLTPLTEYGLHLWKINEAAVVQVRMKLENSAVLISA